MEPKKSKSNETNQPQSIADKKTNESRSKVQFTPTTTTTTTIVPQKNSQSQPSTYTNNPNQNQQYQQPNSQYPQFQQQCQPSSSKQKGQQQYTKIVVRCNAGFGNNLYLRGEGIPNLSWQQGTPMKNVKSDEWYWETNQYFTKAQFKVLFNDKQYEVGDNHWVEYGKTLTFIPYF